MEFRILGSVEVVSDGTRVSIGGRKQRALLALLLLRANEVVPRTSLVDSLWGDTPPEKARASLNVYASRLRKLLARNASGAQLVTRSHGYMLELALDELDLYRFEQLADEAKRALAAGNPALAAEQLRKALALWRGPALADLAEEPFARAEQARLEELRLRALEERIEADLALGRHADLVSELERLAAEHPYRERFRLQLMLALYRSGRQAEALAAYRTARRTFTDELGLEPGPELQQLEQAILRQDDDLKVTASEGESTDSVKEVATAARRWLRWRVVLGAATLLLASGAVTALAVRDSRSVVKIGPNAVAVIDPADNRVVRGIGVGSQVGVTGFERGGSAAFGAGAAWVASARTRSVSQINPRTFGVTPHGVAAEAFNVAAGERYVWITHRLNGFSRLEPEARQSELYSLRSRDGITYSVEGIAVGVGGVWIVAAYPQGLRLLLLDPRAPDRPRRSVSVGVRSNNDVALGANAVWVTNALENRLVRVPLEPGEDVDAIRVAGPSAVAVGGDAVWVASEIDDSVWRVDPETLLVTDQVRVGDGPVDLVVAAGSVWTANRVDGTVSRIDPRARRVVATLSVASTLAAVTAGGGAVWAVSGGDD